MTDRVLKLIAMAALSVACGRDSTLPPLPADPRTVKPPAEVNPAEQHRRALFRALATAELRWHTFAPSGYRLVVSQRCDCDDDAKFESEVFDGRVLSRSGEVRSGKRAESTSIRTVEQLFMRARRVIDSGAHEITVRFDPALGYPAHISIDPRPDVMGDERDWIATLSITRPAPATVFELVK